MFFQKYLLVVDFLYAAICIIISPKDCFSPSFCFSLRTTKILFWGVHLLIKKLFGGSQTDKLSCRLLTINPFPGMFCRRHGVHFFATFSRSSLRARRAGTALHTTEPGRKVNLPSICSSVSSQAKELRFAFA